MVFQPGSLALLCSASLPSVREPGDQANFRIVFFRPFRVFPISYGSIDIRMIPNRLGIRNIFIIKKNPESAHSFYGINLLQISCYIRRLKVTSSFGQNSFIPYEVRNH